MKKQDVLSIMMQIGVEPNDANYEFADKLLREFSMDIIMKMVDIGNEYEFMGDKWLVADNCMTVVSTELPKDLVPKNENAY